MALLSIGRYMCLNVTRRVNFHTLRKSKTILNNQKVPFENPSKRNFFWVFKRRTKREVRLVDQPPEQYELIYRCGLDHYLLSFQHIGFYTTVTICLLTALHAQNLESPPGKKVEYLGQAQSGKEPLATKENDIVFMVGFYLLMFCVLQYIVGRMPVRIYCYPQKQKYIIYNYGAIPNQLKKVTVKAGEIKPKEDICSEPHTWKHDIYKHTKTGQIFFMMENFFRNPSDLYIMLGWQKDPTVIYDEETEKTEKNLEKNKRD